MSPARKFSPEDVIVLALIGAVLIYVAANAVVSAISHGTVAHR